MDKDKIFLWLMIILVVSFSIGLIIGAKIQHGAGRQIAGRAQARETSAELEALAQGYETALEEIKSSTKGILCLTSYYADFHQGRPMANGRPFEMHKRTAAHKQIPLGTIVLLENQANDKWTIARIQDRGPYFKSRTLDVSLGLARELGFEREGLAWVMMTPLVYPTRVEND